MPQPKVQIKAMYRANQNIDVTVAAQDLHAGDTVLRIPEHLIITLKGVFEDEVRLAGKRKSKQYMYIFCKLFRVRRYHPKPET